MVDKTNVRQEILELLNESPRVFDELAKSLPWRMKDGIECALAHLRNEFKIECKNEMWSIRKKTYLSGHQKRKQREAYQKTAAGIPIPPITHQVQIQSKPEPEPTQIAELPSAQTLIERLEEAIEVVDKASRVFSGAAARPEFLKGREEDLRDSAIDMIIVSNLLNELREQA